MYSDPSSTLTDGLERRFSTLRQSAFMEQLRNISGAVFTCHLLITSTHSRYPRFFEFGDAKSCLKGLKRIREEFKSEDQ